MPQWGFLTNHAKALLHIAEHPDARLRDLAGELGVTERTAFGLVNDLAAEGYLIKEREGRRNRYHVQPHLAVHDAHVKQRTVGEIVAFSLQRDLEAAAAQTSR